MGAGSPISDNTHPPFTTLAQVYDEVMRYVPYDEWLEYLIEIFRHRQHAPKKILDLACGTGEMTFRLEKLGYDVCGVDASADMVRVAKEKGEKLRSTARFYTGLAQDFSLLEQFDLVLCVFDSLSNIIELKEFARATRNVAGHLVPGGLFVFDLNTEYAFVSKMFDQDSGPNDKVWYKWRGNYDRRTKLCTVTMEFDAGTSFTETHIQYAYSGEEVFKELKQAGFVKLERFNGYTFFPPGRHSDRVFYVAEMPAPSHTLGRGHEDGSAPGERYEG